MKKKCPLVMLASQKAEGVYGTCLWLNSNNKLIYKYIRKYPYIIKHFNMIIYNEK